jgi:AcrR family transcriptional regulator
MGVAERKERERQELVDHILIKAKEIISQEGFDKLSIRRIATEIEYSPATIYGYFTDKDDLLFQLMNKGFELMATYFSEIYNEPSPVKRIHLLGREYVRFGVEHPDWYELMFQSPNPMNHIKRCNEEWGHGAAIFEFFSKTCEEAIKEKKLKNWEARILAMHLWTSMHGAINFYKTDRLCVIDKEYSNEGKYALIEKMIESIMLNIFHDKM